MALLDANTGGELASNVTGPVTLVDATGGSVQVKLPPITVMGGQTITIARIDNTLGNGVTIIPTEAAGVTIAGFASTSLNERFASITLYAPVGGADWVILDGVTSAAGASGILVQDMPGLWPYAAGIVAGTTGLLLTTNVAIWMYLGKAPLKITNCKLRTLVTVAGAGAQTAEAALATSSGPPDGTNKTLTIPAGGAVSFATALTGTGVIASATITPTTPIAAGAYLWAGMRTAMAVTQPTLLNGIGDFGRGASGTTAAAGVLAAGAYTMTVTPALTLTAPLLAIQSIS